VWLVQQVLQILAVVEVVGPKLLEQLVVLV
jgi:hypothetical protein